VCDTPLSGSVVVAAPAVEDAPAGL